MMYKCILLKLSGEVLQGSKGYGIDPFVLKQIAEELSEVVDMGVQMGIVIGGGNIFRGLRYEEYGFDRVLADYMGMLATLMNCIALFQSLKSLGVKTKIISPIEIKGLTRHFLSGSLEEKKELLLFACGTGNPFFTTDTAAALRALELNCDVLLKGTKVAGVYDKDPTKHKNAKLYRNLSFTEALSKDLKIMDGTAFSLCRDSNLKIVVFDMFKKGNILKAASSQKVGTVVS